MSKYRAKRNLMDSHIIYELMRNNKLQIYDMKKNRQYI